MTNLCLPIRKNADLVRAGSVRLGMLTPSSNTVLEPVCHAMLANLPEISVHFARFRVTKIALSAAANDQFARSGMLDAAAMLADAHVNTVCWNGTSASWLGLDQDRALCDAIGDATAVPATSSVLAMIELLRGAGMVRLGLVTPYTPDVQQQIIATLGTEGFTVVAESQVGLSDNYAFGTVSALQIETMIREVAVAAPQAIVIMCTNMRAAPLVERLEHDLGIPILDSVATAVWGALRVVGIDPARLTGWGHLFRGLQAA